MRILVAVNKGAKSIMLASSVLDYGVGDFLVVSLDLPVVSRVTRPAQRSRTSVSEWPSIQSGSRACWPAWTCRARRPWRDATLRLLRLLDRPEDIPAMAPLVEEILYHLLTGPCGPRLLCIARSDTPSNDVVNATRWLRTHFADPLRVEDLASLAAMCISSLDHHFKEVTAMPPLQYQKQLRLNEARRLMLVERLDVGTAGFRVGHQIGWRRSDRLIRGTMSMPIRDRGV